MGRKFKVFFQIIGGPLGLVWPWQTSYGHMILIGCDKMA